jgi:hypothetical protein
VPALTQWHVAHEVSRQEAHGKFIPAHALIESYAVLTRLPLPRRLDAATARDLLSAWFPSRRVLQAPRVRPGELMSRIAGAGVSGGATYDALVGLTAADHGQELLTRDRRAESTYRRLGIPYRFLD